MVKEKISYLYVSLAVILWASVPAVIKLLLKDLNNIQVLFYSTFMATIGLLLFVLCQKKISLIKEYKIKDYWIFAYMGFIGVFLYHTFVYGALMFSSAQEVSIINYLWPILAVIFALFLLKEKPTIKKFAGILLGFVGVYFVITKGNLFTFSFSGIKGPSLAFIGAICYGLFSILGKKQKYDKLVSIMFYNAFGLIFVLLTILLFSNIPSINFNQFLGLLWIGVFTQGFAFLFWFLALKYGDTTKMSNMIFLTPFLALIFIYFLLDEKILFSSIIGLILIIFGIIIQSFKNKITGIKK